MNKNPNTDTPVSEETETVNQATDTEEAADEIQEEKSSLEQAEETIANLTDRLMRTAAEFDNFKKRSQREKEEIYSNAVCDTIEKMLPVLDNLERAVTISCDNSSDESVLEGVKMIKKQFEDALSSVGVVPMDSVGKPFDPEKHNAVMTEESDGDSNIVLEEFMKGYSYKEKVVRHAMVKVSN